MSVAEEVDLPGTGPIDKKWVYAMVAASAGIVFYAYWKRRSAPAGPVVDPATGGTGGSDSFVNPHPVTSVNTVGGAEGAPTDNQDWTNQVIAAFANLGNDPNGILPVLAKYLAGQPISLDEAAIVRQAWALKGKPPGGPPNFILSASGSTPGTGTTPPPVPPAPAAGRAVEWGTSHATFDWAPVDGATYYQVLEPDGHTWRKVLGNEATFGGALGGDLHGSFTLHVRACNSSGCGPELVLPALQLTGATH